jgi:hypothetical protein
MVRVVFGSHDSACRDGDGERAMRVCVGRSSSPVSGRNVVGVTVGHDGIRNR